MRKIFNFIVKSRIFFLIFWSVVLVASVVLIFNVNINYDTTLYLSKDSETREALIVMEKEFGLNGQANVMVKVSDVKEALQVKKRLAETDGVLEILWLDTLIGEDEIKTTASIIDFISSLDIDLFDFKQFYNKDTGHALYQVLFEEDQYSLKTGKSIEALRDKLDHNLGKKDNYAMSGPAISTYHTQKLTSDEVFKITLYVIPIILIILIIFTNSWAEPLLFIIVVGASVLINMGTNALFNLFGNQSISFLTNSTASLLQLAITMDYAIFLLHRFRKEKETGLPPKEALSKALYHSFLPINSSMLTTAAGFAALMFMSYTIGFDLAIVMIKGILLSIIITFTLMPTLIMLFDKLIVKTEHKPLFPSLKKLATPIYKIRFVLPILAALIVLPVFQKQTANHFVFGESAMSASEGSIAALEIQAIEDRFGKNNMVVLLVPKVDNELGITGISVVDEKDSAAL